MKYLTIGLAIITEMIVAMIILPLLGVSMIFIAFCCFTTETDQHYFVNDRGELVTRGNIEIIEEVL